MPETTLRGCKILPHPTFPLLVCRLNDIPPVPSEHTLEKNLFIKESSHYKMSIFWEEKEPPECRRRQSFFPFNLSFEKVVSNVKN